MGSSPKPTTYEAKGQAICKPDGKKGLPVYVYETFLATPEVLVLRSAIKARKREIADYGQAVGYPNLWHLVLAVESEVNPRVIIRNLTTDELDKLEALLKD